MTFINLNNDIKKQILWGVKGGGISPWKSSNFTGMILPLFYILANITICMSAANGLFKNIYFIISLSAWLHTSHKYSFKHRSIHRQHKTVMPLDLFMQDSRVHIQRHVNKILSYLINLQIWRSDEILLILWSWYMCEDVLKWVGYHPTHLRVILHTYKRQSQHKTNVSNLCISTWGDHKFKQQNKYF